MNHNFVEKSMHLFLHALQKIVHVSSGNQLLSNLLQDLVRDLMHSTAEEFQNLYLRMDE